jgi:hypothetical protein
MSPLFITAWANSPNLPLRTNSYEEPENQADLKVYKVKYENQAGQNDGKWFFVKYSNQAEVKIYFVKYENQAGWRNNSVKHLLY